MDVFNHNWAQQMQTNPIANFILNNYDLEDEVEKEDDDLSYTIWKQVKKKRKSGGRGRGRKRGRDLEYTVGVRKDIKKRWSEKNYKNLEKYRIFEDTPNKEREYNKWYLKRKSIEITPGKTIYTPVKSENHYWANSRPNSLYNLHYASIR